MSTQHPMGLSSLESRKQLRNITAYLARSFVGWYWFQPHLSRYAGIDDDDLQGALLSAAVATAKIIVKRIKIPCVRDQTKSSVISHFDHPFHFPSMPDEFIGSAILERVTHTEWAALGTALLTPVWLESAIVDWARTQNLTLISVVE